MDKDLNLDVIYNDGEIIKGLVSVVIPTYNRKNSVQRAIQSVLNQTYSNFEILVIDDGSTDDTEAVVKRMNDSRIHYYRQENQGSQVARNHGIRLAKGEYIGFLDSDDEWMPEKLNKNIFYMENHDADILFSQFRQIQDGFADRIIPDDLNDGYVPIEIIADSFRVTTDTIFGKCKAIKATLFDVEVKRFQDYDFMVTAAEAGQNIFFEKDILVKQYHSENSITTRVNLDKKVSNFELLLKKHGHIKSSRFFLLRNLKASLIETRGDLTEVSYDIYKISGSNKDRIFYLLSKFSLIYMVLPIWNFIKGK